jgi:hypothetical protein
MEQQSKLKILLTLLIFIFAVLSILFFLFAFNREVIESRLSAIFGGKETRVTATQTTPAVSRPQTTQPAAPQQPAPETPAAPLTPAAPAVQNPSSSESRTDVNGLQRRLINQYKVVTGDTVSGIAYARWGNAYLWPDLYVNNVWRSQDPDLIYPGEVVDILNRLGPNGRFTQQEINAINNAYLEVYNLYKRQGPVRNNSKWYTLYSATRVIPNFLEMNKDKIDADDIKMAQRHASESKAFQ